MGRTLKGTYTLEERVGTGGFGAVYRARHVKLGSLVAVKYLLPHADQQARDRFDREARISASIVHPNVARVLDIDHDEDGSAFIVMEWVGGMSLRAMVAQRGALSLAETTDLFHQFGSAMDAAHAKGVVHRDLKPENLMLTDEGGVVLLKVLDFGIARWVGSSGTLTQGMLIGTPSYLAPETTRQGASVADHRADIYAMGLILYECLVGGRAIEGEAMAIVTGHIRGDIVIPMVHVKRPDIPVEVDSLIQRACSADPAQRYATASDLARALARVPPMHALQPTISMAPTRLGGPRNALTPQSLTPPGPLTEGKATPHEATRISSLSMAAAEIDPEPPRRSRLGLWLGAVVVLLGAGGTLGWWRLHDRGDKVAEVKPAPPAPTPPPPVVTPPPPEPSPTVHLTLRGTPPTVRVFDGDQALSIQDGKLVLPRGNKQINLRFEADGYQSTKLVVVPEADFDVKVDMKRRPSRPKKEEKVFIPT